jgi:hypothetical protein
VNPNDTAALIAQQCRESCGLRANNKPLTTDATLRRTARTAMHEKARDEHSRKLRTTPSARKTTTLAGPKQHDAASLRKPEMYHARHNRKGRPL